MKIISRFIAILAASVTLAVVLVSPVSAQGTIQKSVKPFVPESELKFSFEPASGIPPSAVVPAKFSLQKNQPIHEALLAWCLANDWDLRWQPTVSWLTVRGAAFAHADVVSAVSEVIDTLRFEGKPVALRVSDGNKVMEVISTEVRND